MPLREVSDGSTREEIEGMISDAKTELREDADSRERALDEKLERHAAEVRQIVSGQDSKMLAMSNDLCILVGTEKQPGKVDELIDLGKRSLEKQMAADQRHQEWHEDDLAFRDQVTKTQESMSKDLSALRWLVKLSVAGRRVGSAVIKAPGKGKETYEVGAFLLTAWVAAVQFFHIEVPWLHRFTKGHPTAAAFIALTAMVLLFFMHMRKKKDEEDKHSDG